MIRKGGGEAYLKQCAIWKGVDSETSQSSFPMSIVIGCALVLGALVIFTIYIKKKS